MGHHSGFWLLVLHYWQMFYILNKTCIPSCVSFFITSHDRMRDNDDVAQRHFEDMRELRAIKLMIIIVVVVIQNRLRFY